MTNEQGTSSYATGGGGTVLEHVYGATLLAALLLGDPVPGLGDEQTVVTVQFQASSLIPVDDFVVTGEVRGTPQPSGRRLAIAVRRNPTIAPSDASFVALLGDFLQVVEAEWPSIVSGKLRLGLTVAAPHTGIQELGELVHRARTQAGYEEFKTTISAPRAVNAKIRTRLDHLERAVERAVSAAAVSLPEGGVSELTWRLLVGLGPIETRLEGSVPRDRTEVVGRLRRLVGDASDADKLFTTLCTLASRYAPAGATIDEATLRRDLAGLVRLGPSALYSRAWEVFEALSSRLDTQTGQVLTSVGDPSLHLARDEARHALIDAMRLAITAGRPLIVTGDPDVGKSALALAAMRELTTEGEQGIAMSLADLPASVHEIVSLLGAPLRSVIGAMAVSPLRFMLIDGAESAALEKDVLLAELAHAARETGVGLVVVTRSDARAVVMESLDHKRPGSAPPQEFEVRGLTKAEIAQVIATFPSLKSIAREPRSHWVLERPGLVDLLLKSEAHAVLPDGALSEADVFTAIWLKLVRRSERSDAEHGSPDAREGALLAIAGNQLTPGAAGMTHDHAMVIPGLRSDGLLLDPGPLAAWSSEEQFATDLVRDFALARLFVKEGWSLLRQSGCPRWALRAARLACQGLLMRRPERIESVFQELQSEFGDLAAGYGDRWADLPLESLLTLGSPSAVLERLWPKLIADDAVLLRRLLRIALQRHTDSLAAAPDVVEPVMHLLVDHADDVGGQAYDVREAAGDLEIRWLRGLALRRSEDASNPLRCHIRDALIGRDTARYSDQALETLALMGANLNEAVEQRLRAVAATAPQLLAPCVETLAPLSLAVHRPDLLLDLSEAYYIEQPHDDDRSGYGFMDDGVRDHQGRGGLGSPMAAWHFGSFWHLLWSVPQRAIPFINRLLDHAARHRVTALSQLSSPRRYGQKSDNYALPPIEIDLPQLGRRSFVGDSHVWSWYRGSSVGPYPCMSALLAVERFVDQIHDAWGLGLGAVTELLLRDCNNLAMPGLVVGYLVRHLEEVVDELDPWLAEPAIWRLEFGRATSEGHLHAQGRDPDDLHGRGNRQLTLRDAASYLTTKAIVTNDDASIARLRSVADSLLKNASAEYSGKAASAGPDDRIEVARSWASFLVAENYALIPRPDGTHQLQFTPPELSRELVEQQADRDRGMLLLRLLAYGADPDRRPNDISNLVTDLRIARDLYEDPPTSGSEFAADAFPAVAAAAIVAFADGRIDLPREDLNWAIGITVDTALALAHGHVDEYSIYSLGSDRSTAVAVPYLLLPCFNEDDLSWLDDDDRAAIRHALEALMLSGSEEVRRRTATALRRVWAVPCDSNVGNRTGCRHVVALATVEAAIRDCRQGPFDAKQQRRRVEPIIGDVIESLRQIAPSDLLLHQLTSPLVAASACAASKCCVAERATMLLDALLRAHAEGAVHWFGKTYRLDQNPEVQQTIAECLIETAGAGNVGALLEYAKTLMAQPRAIHQLLEEIARIATYESTSRRTVIQVWPAVMTSLLDMLESGRAFLQESEHRRNDDRGRGDAIAALLLAPQGRMTDSDLEKTLRTASRDWLQIDTLEPHLDRWLPFGEGFPKCVDSLVNFLRTQPETVQASRGLDLVLRVVGKRFDRIANHSWHLGEWLQYLLTSELLDSEQMVKFQVLVDGLVASGDTGALRIQKAIE